MGQEMDWLPIETAPKEDGSVIVVYAEKGVGKKSRRVKGSFASVARRSRFWGWLSVPSDYQLHPTHWMPLPAPPEPGK